MLDSLVVRGGCRTRCHPLEVGEVDNCRILHDGADIAVLGRRLSVEVCCMEALVVRVRSSSIIWRWLLSSISALRWWSGLFVTTLSRLACG